MANLQTIFDRMQETKKEQSELKKSYRESLANSKSYQDVVEELTKLRDKKKKIEGAIKDDFKSEFSRLEQIKLDLESDKEIMSDLAMNQLVKGESIKIIDQYENQYEPVFNVKFKKIG